MYLFIYYRKEGSWFDHEAFLFTLRRILSPISIKMKKENKNKHGLIIFDNMRAHYNSEVLEELKF